MEPQGPILGVSLYSFTNEWGQRLFTFDDLVAKVAELGLGPAVEVIGFQSFRDYPDVSDEFAAHFRELLDRYGLMPSSLGGNLDVGRRRDRLMTDEETADYIERQIVSAHKLGFPVLRIQHHVHPAVLEKITPIAEKAGVHVACELHAPMTPDRPEVMELRACYDRIGSPFLGFIPDFSASMTRVPEVYWDSLRRAGAPEGLIEAAADIWLSDRSAPEKFGALAEAATRFNANPAVAGRLNSVMTMFARMPGERWNELLPYVRHIHGKFYGVDASGQEASIPYPALMSLLKRAGYQGTMSAEWEGHAFTEEPIGMQQVQAWHAMVSRLLAA